MMQSQLCPCGACRAGCSGALKMPRELRSQGVAGSSRWMLKSFGIVAGDQEVGWTDSSLNKGEWPGDSRGGAREG